MSRGLPVVATHWSGNTDFLCHQNGMPVTFRMVPARDPQFTYDHPELRWADADINAAAKALLELRRNPDLANGIGDEAFLFGRQNWSAGAYASVCKQLNLRPYLQR
jgi:hypothetical protein